MSSRTRESRIIAAVPCHTCGAAVGEQCDFTPAERRKLFGGVMLRGGIAVHGRRREAWQALHDRDEGVEREVDGRLSDRAAHYWPGAVVVCEYITGGEQRWYLERGRPDRSLARTGIGSNYHAAVRALGAIIRSEETRRSQGAAE